MSTDVICQLAYDGKLQELQSKLQTDLKLACKKFQVFIFFYNLFYLHYKFRAPVQKIFVCFKKMSALQKPFLNRFYFNLHQSNRSTVCLLNLSALDRVRFRVVPLYYNFVWLSNDFFYLFANSSYCIVDTKICNQWTL